MCMYNEQGIEVAKRDIICYKVISLVATKKGVYCLRREFNHYCPIKGGLRKASGFPKDDTELSKLKNEGGFYAYLSKKYAMEHTKWSSNALVLKCLIPKGVRYIKGMQNYYFSMNAIRAEYMIHGVM